MIAQFARHLRQLTIDPDLQLNLLASELSFAAACPLGEAGEQREGRPPLYTCPIYASLHVLSATTNLKHSFCVVI